MVKQASTLPEFSRPVPIERLEEGDFTQTISANEAERAALARRFGLLALDRLEAEISLRRIARGPVLRLEGRLAAAVVQSCVLSLEPVEGRIDESFAVLYQPEGYGSEHGGANGTETMEAGEDWPEPILDGRIDIGEATAQQLVLALDPYPRKPGIELEDVIGPRGAGDPASPGGGKDGPAGPFAALAGLAKRKA
jgi:hypothetical protein